MASGSAGQRLTAGPDEPPRARRWAVVAGVCAAPFTLGLALLVLTDPPEIESALFASALVVATAGAITAPRRRRRLRFVVRGSLAAALALVVWRAIVAGEGETIRASVEPGGGARILDRLLPERDVALGGTRLLLMAHAMPEDEPGLLDALRDGYRRMRDAEGPVPSPVLGSFVHGQHPDEHVVLRIAAGGDRRAAVVFLHGYIGNVTLLCWQVAQAAGPAGVETVCPSTHWHGAWWTRRSEAIARHTIEALRAEGFERVYLAGLSNGSVGASRIAARLPIDGLILISGADGGVPRTAQVPTLVLQGARDRMTRPGPARAYARRAHGEYVEYPDAGHWLILSHHDAVRARIEGFLRDP